MSFKKWMALAMTLALLLTGMVGCKSTGTGEEAGAVVDEYVESDPSDAPAVPEDLPEKVENPEGFTPDEPEDEPEDEQDTPAPDTADPDTSAPDAAEPEASEPDTTDPEEEVTVEYDQKNLIKILDYNLRYANDPNGRSIKERAERFREVMEKYQPDIMGFQEVVPEWMEYLTADYPDYEYHLQYRSQTSKEATPVFWNTKTMEKVDCGHFWLSDTPDVESIGTSWGYVEHYRVVTWAKLRVKATGKEFVFFSTHQNNAGTHPENSAKTILMKAKQLGVGTQYGGFCMGDYNIEPWTKGYTAMLEEGLFGDVNGDLENLPDVTNHGYHDSNNPHIIDYVFYTPDKVHPLHYEVVDMEINGNYVSDHRGLYVEAALL